MRIVAVYRHIRRQRARVFMGFAKIRGENF